MARRPGTIVKRPLKSKAVNGRQAVVWDAAISVGKGADRKRHWKYGFATKAEAEAWLRSAGGAADKGVFVERSGVLFGDYARKWLDERPNLKATTRRGYAVNIERHLIPALGMTPIQQVSADQLTALYATLTKRGLTGATVHRVHAIAFAILKHAVVKGLVARNAAALVVDAGDLPKEVRPKVKFWQEADARKFLAWAERTDDDLRALWRLILAAGLRRGEALGLRWADVDIDPDPKREAAGMIRIERTRVVLSGGVVADDTPKSDAGLRSIAIDKRTAAWLREHRARQAAARLKAGAAWVDTDLLFVDALGNGLHPTPSGRGSVGP